MAARGYKKDKGGSLGRKKKAKKERNYYHVSVHKLASSF